MNDIEQRNKLITCVRKSLDQRKYDEAESVLCKALAEYPHSAIPHNLYGILLEKKGMHVEAMKHFRAAWNFDPTYLPSRYNLDIYASFDSVKSPAYREEDIPADKLKDKKF